MTDGIYVWENEIEQFPPDVIDNVMTFMLEITPHLTVILPHSKQVHMNRSDVTIRTDIQDEKFHISFYIFAPTLNIKRQVHIPLNANQSSLTQQMGSFIFRNRESLIRFVLLETNQYIHEINFLATFMYSEWSPVFRIERVYTTQSKQLIKIYEHRDAAAETLDKLWCTLSAVERRVVCTAVRHVVDEFVQLGIVHNALSPECVVVMRDKVNRFNIQITHFHKVQWTSQYIHPFLLKRIEEKLYEQYDWLCFCRSRQQMKINFINKM